jgi:hypothetical protein
MRRSSLSVSKWYAPPGDGSGAKSKPKLLRKSELRDSMLGMTGSIATERSLASLSPTPSTQAGPTSLPIYPQSAAPSTARRSEIWEPPISCQKRIYPSTNYQAFFPFELTDRDYYQRLVNIIILAVEDIETEQLQRRLEMSNLMDFSEPLEEFVNILIANSSSSQAPLITQRLHQLYNLSNESMRTLTNCAQTFLRARESFANHISGYSGSRLSGQDDLFQQCRLLLTSLREVSSNSTQQQSIAAISSTLSATVVCKNDLLQKELKDWMHQYKLQQTSQTQRMATLGWQWTSADEPQSRSSASSTPELSNISVFSTVFTTPVTGEALSRWKSLQDELVRFLQPQIVAKILFIARIHHVIFEITTVSKAVSVDRDYAEAQRLRTLVESLQGTIDDNTDLKTLFEEAKAGHHMLKLLIADLQQNYQDLRQSKALDAIAKMAETEKAIKQATTMLKKLYKVISPAPFLSGVSNPSDPKNIPARINREGPGIITSDLLYFEEHPNDSWSLGGLLARTDHLGLIESVRQWPGLSALQCTPHNPSPSPVSSPYSPHSRSFASFSGNKSPVNGNQTEEREEIYDEEEKHSTSTSRMNLTALGNSILLPMSPTSRIHGGSLTVKQQFSKFVAETLQAFEQLVSQLQALLSPAAVAYTELIIRLIGMHCNLQSLTDMNAAVGNTVEKARLSVLVTTLEDTLLTDEVLENHYGEDDPGNVGRGRQRVDHIWQLCNQVQQSLQEIAKLRTKAKAISDYTAAAALDEMYHRLNEHVQQVLQTITPFSLLDSENDIMGSEALDINERIAREGTDFFTSDFLFCYSSGPKGHSMGSLAIVAGAGVMLRFIKTHWPELTALGNNNTNPNSGPMPSSSNLANNALSGNAPGGNNSSTDGAGEMNDVAYHHPSQSTTNQNELFHHRRRSSVFSFAPNMLSSSMGGDPSSAASATAAIAAASGNLTAAIPTVDFRDAHAMRLLGFDPRTLLCAGFQDIDILTAGYSVEQLRVAGFDAHHIHQVMGLYNVEILANHPNGQYAAGSGSVLNTSTLHMMHMIGGGLFHQLSTLYALYQETDGSHWKRANYWHHIAEELHVAASNKLDHAIPTSSVSAASSMPSSPAPHQQNLITYNNSIPGAPVTRLQQQQRLHHLLSRLPGITFNSQILEIQGLSLSQNDLRGHLPSDISLLVSLKHLDISHNHLTGELPSSLGLLVNLEHFHADHNDFSGEIPKTLKNLPQLISLRLNHNRFSGALPTSLATLSKLKRLDVSFNNLSSSLPQRYGTGLASIQEMLLHHNQITGEIPTSWGNLVTLTHLELQHNLLTGPVYPDMLMKWQKMTCLNLQENKGLLCKCYFFFLLLFFSFFFSLNHL